MRKIIHIDMDAFYASVEQRDRPELKGKPVIVGGAPDRRGVVAACSYEARRFGIHSAMPGRTARRKCPQAVFLRPRFDVYRAVSRRIRDIFLDYTDLVEPLSLDEAYLDVTVNRKGMASATHIAREIRRRILAETALTASAGVSFNKFLAKTASDVNKPDGIFVITPDEAAAFIDQLPIRRFFGVGRATEKKMKAAGIHFGRDLKNISLKELTARFGKAGRYFHEIAHARDNRPVTTRRERKSIGKETTFPEDIGEVERLEEILGDIAEKLAAEVTSRRLLPMTLTMKLKYADFQQITRSISRRRPILSAGEMRTAAVRLLDQTAVTVRKARLIGISLSSFASAEPEETADFPEQRGHVQLPLPLWSSAGSSRRELL